MAYGHKPKGDGKVFKNPVLDKLTRTHIAWPLTIFYGLAAVLLFYTLYEGFIGAGASILLFVAGLLSFTLVEYLVHRYTFHMEADTPKKERLQYVLHGAHHDYPKDKTRLAMPPHCKRCIGRWFFSVIQAHHGELRNSIHCRIYGWLCILPVCALFCTCISSSKKFL